MIFGSYFNGGVRVHDISNPFQPREIAHFIPDTPKGSKANAIQINDVFVDENRLIYAVDRFSGGLYILEMTVEPSDRSCRRAPAIGIPGQRRGRGSLAGTPLPRTGGGLPEGIPGPLLRAPSRGSCLQSGRQQPGRTKHTIMASLSSPIITAVSARHPQKRCP